MIILKDKESEMTEKYTDHHRATTLVTRKEAAEFLGVAESTLAYWKSVGRYDLKYVKIGRLIKYRISYLEEFIEQGLNGH